MGLSPDLLGNDEVEVLHLRTHVKALVAPAILLPIVAAASGLAFAATPVGWQPWGSWLVLAATLAAVGAWVVVPFVKWLSTTYTFTNRRIITRRGVVVRSGHDLPLSRIQDVSYRHGPIDRLLGCGTLVLTTAAEAPVTLDDIPDVERVHVMMTELIFGSGQPAAGE